MKVGLRVNDRCYLSSFFSYVFVLQLARNGERVKLEN